MTTPTIALRWVMLALTFVAAAELPGQRRQSLSSLRSTEKITAIFTAVVADANRSTVVLRRGARRVCFGTVVRREGLVVAKHSELGSDEVQCELPSERGSRYAIRRVGVDEPNDLALLEVVDADGEPLALTAASFATATPQTGAWLATADGRGAPVGIGILSAAPYEHSTKRGYLGVQMDREPVPPRIELVQEGTAADAAGLRADDVILAVDQQAVETSRAFIAAIARRLPGDEIALRVQRGESEVELTAELRSDRRGRTSGQERIWGPLSDVRSGYGLVLQHDTVLRPDQCGGPVVDLVGDVVGVNIARAGRVETLALPAATVIGSVRKILGSRRSRDD